MRSCDTGGGVGGRDSSDNFVFFLAEDGDDLSTTEEADKALLVAKPSKNKQGQLSLLQALYLIAAFSAACSLQEGSSLGVADAQYLLCCYHCWWDHMTQGEGRLGGVPWTILSPSFQEMGSNCRL